MQLRHLSLIRYLMFVSKNTPYKDVKLQCTSTRIMRTIKHCDITALFDFILGDQQTWTSPETWIPLHYNMTVMYKKSDIWPHCPHLREKFTTYLEYPQFNQRLIQTTCKHKFTCAIMDFCLMELVTSKTNFHTKFASQFGSKFVFDVDRWSIR